MATGLKHVNPPRGGLAAGPGRPRGRELWVPLDRTAGVIGPQGSGKTLDLLTPALLAAPGAALVTLTKPDDLLLTLDGTAQQRRAGRSRCSTRSGSPPALPELVWDPIDGCVDPMVAERRAKAFTAGTVKGAAAQAARARRRPVLRRRGRQGAAGLLPRRRPDRPHPGGRAALGRQPAAAPRSRPRSCASTRTPHRSGTGCCTARCTATTGPPGTRSPPSSRRWACSSRSRSAAAASPAAARPATDIADLIRPGGTIYLLGREDPYASPRRR